MQKQSDLLGVSFTGTQVGMTGKQVDTLTSILATIERPFFGIHGDYIGSDAQFDSIARLAVEFSHMVVRPMRNAGSKRAHCWLGADDTVHEPREPLLRNRDIVDDGEVLFATPKEPNQVLRSGTWATVRYATSAGKPIIVILPNGVAIEWK